MTEPQKTGHKNIFNRLVEYIDHTQQKHPVLALPYAVIKKYGDDDAGHQAALITYYGFLSLFPLLLVATSVVDLVAQQNTELHARLLNNINSYFPIVGSQLQSQVHSTKTGLALVVGLIVAIYGTRGIANVIRSAQDHVWATPRAKRSGFPKNVIKGFALLLGAGLGLVFTTTLASYATAALGQSWLLRAVPVALNIGLLYLIFMYVLLIGPSRKRARKDIRLAAIMAASGIIVLQTVGGYLITHQLQNLRGLYGQFALVLAILFWIYLQAQVFMFALETTVVRALQLWPRSITSRPTTQADQKAYRLYAKRVAYRPKSEEEITVTFHSNAPESPTNK